MCRWKLLEITIQPAMKYFTVCDLCFMAFTGLKLDFPLQVDVVTGKQAEFYVLID